MDSKTYNSLPAASTTKPTYLDYEPHNTVPGGSLDSPSRSGAATASARLSVDDNAFDTPKDSRSGSNKADATSTLSPDAARSGRSSYDTHRVSTSERSRSRDMRYKVDAEARHRGIKDKFMDKLVPEFLK